MGTQAQPSQHLAAARGLLEELKPATEGTGGDPQTKATAAMAHAVLVLAEQVAAARLVMAADAVQRADGQPAPHH
jgi:hypothetical protein